MRAENTPQAVYVADTSGCSRPNYAGREPEILTPMGVTLEKFAGQLCALRTHRGKDYLAAKKPPWRRQA